MNLVAFHRIKCENNGNKGPYIYTSDNIDLLIFTGIYAFLGSLAIAAVFREQNQFICIPGNNVLHVLIC